MANLIPYIAFPGTCRQALEFYATCLQGSISSIRTFGESPIDVPDESQERIFDSEFQAGDIRFKASDDLPSHPVNVGSNISLFVSFDDSQTRQNAFQQLSAGGKVLFPLDENFGMLSDRFDIQWMFVGVKD